MYKLVKRFFDFFISLIGLILLFPLLIPVFFLLRFTGEGEIFYKQERIGYKNNSFGILKFATMLKNSANIGSGLVTTRNDVRITPLGKFLRISKINELPQIWNVFNGNMSFVGPRPLPKTSTAKYSQDVQAILYTNRPGITGIGSLVFRDEEKLVTAVKDLGKDPLVYYKSYIYPYKGTLELWYHKNINFKTDLIILFLTFWSLLDKNSNLVFRFFKTLPPKPSELTLKGIKTLY